MLRRWRKRATCWMSWKSSACLGPGGPREGPSPRCWTSQWTNITHSPETSEPPPPAPPCSPTGCWLTLTTPALPSAQFAPSTLTKFLCTRLRTEEGPRSDRATPKAERAVKMACSRCRALLAGLGPCCRRCSVYVQVSRRGGNRRTDISLHLRTDSTVLNLNRSTGSKLSASPSTNSHWVNILKRNHNIV